MPHVVWVLLLATAPNVAIPGFPTQDFCEIAFSQVIFSVDKKPEHKCIQVDAASLPLNAPQSVPQSVPPGAQPGNDGSGGGTDGE